MVGIVSTGIGSGLDVNSLVQQLIAAEGQPVQQRLAIKESQYQSKLSAYGSLKSALSALKTATEKLQNAETFDARTIASSNEEAVTVSVQASAVPARYSVNIVSTAVAERLTSGAFASAETTVGTGSLAISVGGAAFEVAIDAENNTVGGIADAINASADNTGVQATVINAEGGSYLVISGNDTGTDNKITVTQSGGDGGLAALAYDPANGLNQLTLSEPAADAEATVNGFQVFSATNVFDDVIAGVSFNALKATDGEALTVTVANDTAGVKKSLQTFVNAYNAFIETSANLSAYDAETKVAGALQGDSTLRGVSNLLRRELSENTDGIDPLLDTLSEIGVSLDEDGKLEIDEAQIDTLNQENYGAISALFGGEKGYGSRLIGVLDAYIDSDGILQARTDGLQSSIDRLEQQNEALNRRLQSLESRLLRQFNGLDSLLSQLNSTSSFLAAQLSNVPTPGRNNN